ncbi:MAG: hypothetical protein IJ091_08600 [Oscillospiraceae bacterium]|nr:hypothetical protein [Oscillospiraceae bacterium]
MEIKFIRAGKALLVLIILLNVLLISKSSPYSSQKIGILYVDYPTFREAKYVYEIIDGFSKENKNFILKSGYCPAGFGYIDYIERFAIDGDQNTVFVSDAHEISSIYILDGVFVPISIDNKVCVCDLSDIYEINNNVEFMYPLEMDSNASGTYYVTSNVRQLSKMLTEKGIRNTVVNDPDKTQTLISKAVLIRSVFSQLVCMALLCNYYCYIQLLTSIDDKESFSRSLQQRIKMVDLIILLIIFAITMFTFTSLQSLSFREGLLNSFVIICLLILPSKINGKTKEEGVKQ